MMLKMDIKQTRQMLTAAGFIGTNEFMVFAKEGSPYRFHINQGMERVDVYVNGKPEEPIEGLTELSDFFGDIELFAWEERQPALELHASEPSTRKVATIDTITQHHIGDDILEHLSENRPNEDANYVVSNSTANELLDMYLNWNGIIGYTDSIIAAVDLLREFVKAEPTTLHKVEGRPASPLTVGQHLVNDHFGLRFFRVLGFINRNVVLQPVNADGSDNGADLRSEGISFVYNALHDAEMK